MANVKTTTAIRLKSHMPMRSLRQIRFAVSAAPDEAETEGQPFVPLSGVLSYDLFRKSPTSDGEATELFVRNADAILAGFMNAWRRTHNKPNIDGTALHLVPADLPSGILS